MSPVFPVFLTEATVSIVLKKRTQSGNIHSIILEVHAVKQSSLIIIIVLFLYPRKY